MIYEGGQITKNEFSKLLETNPGLIILKFGADWCGPCKVIEPLVIERMKKLPNTAHCFLINIDHSIELYGFLKTKKIINGIPAILAYYQGNVHYIPDEVTIGADKNHVNTFFNTCENYLKSM